MVIDISAIKESCANSKTRFFAGVGEAVYIDSVFVDGKRMSDVIFVDIEHGVGIRVVKDLEGKLLVVGDEVLHELFLGKIELTWRYNDGNTT